MKWTVLILFAVIIVAGGCENDKVQSGAALTEVTYVADDAQFPNPERGFYRYTESRPGASPSMLNENTLKGYREQNITLIYRVYYLKDFRNKAISQQALNQMTEDMATLRRAGLKCVLRFAYSGSENEADAPLNIVLQHLEQLRSVFEANADVIAVLQAGFIGAWGEWYYSSNNLKTQSIRAAILDRMLDVLPSRRMIQLRTPAYKTEYLQNATALTGSTAFTGSGAARIGHHNDCFMASPTDYGTYADVEKEKAYINSEGVYVPVGGETCPPSGVDPADCRKAEGEMRNLRWSFLNADYYRGVNDRWTTLGCMDNIIRELGYRFVLQSVSCNGKAAPGSAVTVELSLNNTGYACPYNPRKMEFVLKNTVTAEIYLAVVDEDPRFWKPNVPENLKFSLGLPKDMPAGFYGLYLNLPDPEPLLYGRPEYSIRMANRNVWEAATGYNNLQHRIEVGGNPSSAYSGDMFFERKGSAPVR